jgi:hypothetical protein
MALRGYNNVGQPVFGTAAGAGDNTVGNGFPSANRVSSSIATGSAGVSLATLAPPLGVTSLTPVGNPSVMTPVYFNDLYNFRRTGAYDPRLGYPNAYPFGYGGAGYPPTYISPYEAQFGPFYNRPYGYGPNYPYYPASAFGTCGAGGCCAKTPYPYPYY